MMKGILRVGICDDKLADLKLIETAVYDSAKRVEISAPIESLLFQDGEKMYEERLMAEEGMQETANKMISIGKPIQFDEERFMKQLEELRDYVVQEPDDIREHIKQMVDTYSYRSEST